MDTGVRYFHKDLGGSLASYSDPTNVDGNMWVNWDEKNGVSGVDDDGNGYVDDWVGWDWVNGVIGGWPGEDCNIEDNDPRDFNGHGTHCAGIVAAITNNGYATSSPAGGWGNGALQPSANGVKVMALRIGWSGKYNRKEVGYVRMDFAAEAFYYAANNGAKIASCSWGCSNSGGIAAAIDYFLASGGMIFKAAGNDGTQIADYMCSRTDIISVAATDENDCKASFSTYGTWVDISAPGVNILSLYHLHTDPVNDYVASMGGTSMATPLAASVAALIWSQNPSSLTATLVEQNLYNSADDIDSLPCNIAYSGKLGAGRINAFNAVGSCDVTPAFSGSPTSGCAPLTVNFAGQSTGTGAVSSWDWDFGDGVSSEQNPSHTYIAAGIYNVSLTAHSLTCSATETKINYITVTGVPVANFVGSPTSGNAPLTVHFTDRSTNSPTIWSWAFGDGGTSIEQNPSHIYTNPGTNPYTVTLTASNSCGDNTEIKTGFITVTVPPPNNPPVAKDDIATTPEDTAVVIDVLVNDTDPDIMDVLTVSAVSLCTNGGSVVNNSNSVTYTPSANFNGSDSFTYTASDGHGGTDTATVDVTVTAVNDAPDAVNDIATTPEDTAVVIDVLVNDTDPDMDSLTVIVVSQGTHGSVVNKSNSVTYTPSANFNGADSFTYTASDGHGGIDTATVDVTVAAVNDAPDAVNDIATTPENTAVNIDVLVNDTDPDMMDVLTVSDVSLCTNGGSVVNNSNSVIYTPSANFNGPDSFTYTASDGHGGTDTATVNVTVTAASSWTVLTSDNFESGFGNYTIGGIDCMLYTGGTYAHQGIGAANIQDNSGTSSSFFYTTGQDVSGYTEIEIDFWFYAVSMDTKENFWVQYFDGSAWRTVANFVRGTDFNNGIFYNKTVTINSADYNFPTNMKIRFMCDASNDGDDVYIDEIEVRAK